MALRWTTTPPTPECGSCKKRSKITRTSVSRSPSQPCSRKPTASLSRSSSATKPWCGKWRNRSMPGWRKVSWTDSTPRRCSFFSWSNRDATNTGSMLWTICAGSCTNTALRRFWSAAFIIWKDSSPNWSLRVWLRDCSGWMRSSSSSRGLCRGPSAARSHPPTTARSHQSVGL